MAAPRAQDLAPLCLAITLSLFALAAATAARAQTWNEIGDAGDLPATAQTTIGTGPLTQINGNLASPTDVDMFCVTAGSGSYVCLQCVLIQGPDLWIFDATGKGVAANSTCSGGCKLVTAVLSPGTYYVAVSYDGIYPLSGSDPIWIPGNFPQRAPDGPGAAGVVTSWTGSPIVQPLNPYSITLGNATYCGIVNPALKQTWGRLKMLYR